MNTTVKELKIPQFKVDFESAANFYWKNGFHIEEELFDDLLKIKALLLVLIINLKTFFGLQDKVDMEYKLPQLYLK